MERYQRGHQQPVEGERPIGVLLVFACLTVAIAAVLWGLNAARQQRPGAAFDSGSDSAVASQKMRCEMRTIRMSLSRRKPFCGRSTSGLALRRIRLGTTRLRSGLHGLRTDR